MYEDHYGLSGRPFQLTPDPRFWFDTATHRKAMSYLGYGLSQGEGFIVITGDVGAGKTTLVGHLMAKIDRDRLNVIKIVSTQIEADDLLRMVATGLEIASDGMTKSQLLTAIERGLHATARGGRRTLLIVDEAQALPVSSLEELRMLSNFQAGGHALLQIFLLGQPEFRERLHGSERLEQLRQRVIAVHHLDPMGPEEVAPYMQHRLSVVGWTGRPGFTEDAYAAIHAGSDGIPRRLNQLAGRVLLYGAIEQLDTIDAGTVEAVIADIAGDAPERVAAPAPLRIVQSEDAPLPMTPAPLAVELPHEAAPELLARIESLEESVAETPTGLMEAIASIEARLENVSAGPRVDRGLLARLTSLEKAAANPPRTDPAVEARLAAYESRAEQIALAAFDIDEGLRLQMAMLEERIERAATVQPSIDPDFVAHVATLHARVAELEARPSDLSPQLKARIASIEERIDDAVIGASNGDMDARARIASLEARVEEQEAALRRVLTLLVDWVEGDQSGDRARHLR
ncbi:ExeA family protein [Sphingomonas immobilis]|uniref:AAA family ATPase n=1 Tax=Sphingomonas immobilis TaxID=3063997 RepID=A0ABT9A4D4_9SPHN|nr:AAA family ATPase [Sphingomonas sp. CA1-15]MDO7844292.1 AAA family ATPase [Sphingomonas sp. CA1-15]